MIVVVGDVGRDLLFEFVEFFFYLITLFIIVIGDTVLFVFECEPRGMEIVV